MSEDRGRMMVLADLPAGTEREFILHLQAFDREHPGCTFHMMMSAPNQTLTQVATMLEGMPGFRIIDVAVTDKKKLS